MKTQILNDLLGTVSLVNYIVAFIFVFLALTLKWIWKTIRAIKSDEKSPDKFILLYWIERNLIPKLLSLVANVISIFFIFRLSGDLFNVQFSYAFAIVVGFTLDYWIDRLKKIKPNFFTAKKK